MDITKRKCAHESTIKYCPLSSDTAYIEVTEWVSGDGYDIECYDDGNTDRMGITHGQFKLLKKLIKKLNNE